MSEMQYAETVERLREGLKKAASRAKELGKAQKNNHWFQVAGQLRGLLDNCEKLLKEKALTENQIEGLLSIREKKLDTTVQ